MQALPASAASNLKSCETAKAMTGLEEAMVKGPKEWLQKQSAAIQIAASSFGGAAQGAFTGGLLGMIMKDFGKISGNQPGAANPQMAQSPLLVGGPLVLARNFAVFSGTNALLTEVIKRARQGKEDIWTYTAAYFGSGCAFGAISGVGTPQGITTNGVIGSGVSFALFQALFFTIGQAFGGNNKEEDINFIQSQAMLKSLGFEEYEKNFRKSKLTDRTIPLLNERSLSEAKIPPGPTLLILEHVKNTDYSFLQDPNYDPNEWMDKYFDEKSGRVDTKMNPTGEVMPMKPPESTKMPALQ